MTLGATKVTRRVSASGLLGICYQQISAGRLIRTVPRRTTKEVVQHRAHRPDKPKRRPPTN